MSKRLFIALPLPAAVVFQLEQEMEQMKEKQMKGRFVPPQNLHITLAFIGCQSIERTEALMESFSKLSMPALPLEIEGAGYFKNLLYASVKKTRALEQFADRVRECAETIGIKLEERPLIPHITLARDFRHPRGEEPQIAFQSFTAEECILYQSLAQKKGPVYVPLVTLKANQAQFRPES